MVTIKAVSQMHKVNVLIVNEDEKCFYNNGFNINYSRTITIAYRLKIKDTDEIGSADEWETIENETSTIAYCCEVERNNYESVCHIEQDVIFKIAKSIASVESKKINLFGSDSIAIDDENSNE